HRPYGTVFRCAVWYSQIASTANVTIPDTFDADTTLTTLLRSNFASIPSPATSAPTRPAIAPPAMYPDERSVPGLNSSSPFPFRARSTMWRTSPPQKMGTDVEMGRYTPTANGRELTPQSSITSDSITPINTRLHGSFLVRIPSMIKANKLAFGASNFF